MSALHPQTEMIRDEVLRRDRMKRLLKDSVAPRALLDAHGDVLKPVVTRPRAVPTPPPAREPVLVHISHAEMTSCMSGGEFQWGMLCALLGMKGVPDDRLQGRPEVRIDERDDGLMLEIA